MKKSYALMLLTLLAAVPAGVAAQSGCTITLPWTEDFEGIATGGTNFAPCWTRVDSCVSGTAIYPNVYAYGSAHGNVLNFMGNGMASNGTLRAATPRIPAPLNTLELSFAVYKNTLTLYAATAPADLSTYTYIGSYAPGYVWTTYEVRTDTVPGIASDMGYLVFTCPYGSGYSNGNRLVRKAETNAGDLTADAMRWLTGAQIGLSNGGGIRVDLPAGDITYGDIMSLLPFDNLVCKIEATGAQILEMLRIGTANLPNESGDFPQVSGLRYTATVADHSISNVEVEQPDGSYLPLDPTATYTIGTYDYTVVGGFGGSLASCTVLSQSSTLYRDALVQYIATALGGTIGQQYAAPQGRITIVQ